MIRCEDIDGKLTIITDDADAEMSKLDTNLEDSEWETEFNATRMVDGLLTWAPTFPNDDARGRFVDLVGLEPGDVMKYGYE